MILEVYIVLLIAALLGTAAVVWIGSAGGVGSVNVGAKHGIVLSAGVFALWGLLAIESFEIVVTSGGQEFTRSYQQLAWICVAGAGISLLSMFQASIEEIKNSGGI